MRKTFKYSSFYGFMIKMYYVIQKYFVFLLLLIFVCVLSGNCCVVIEVAKYDSPAALDNYEFSPGGNSGNVNNQTTLNIASGSLTEAGKKRLSMALNEVTKTVTEEHMNMQEP